MNVRLARHWIAVLAAAAALSALAALPFATPTAGYVVVLTTAGVGMAGLATAPAITRKGHRP